LLPAGPSCAWPRPVPALAPASDSAPRAVPATAPASGRTRTRTRTRGRTRAVTGESAEVHFAADLADGQVPSVRRI
jgi:hypothetical protein